MTEFGFNERYMTKDGIPWFPVMGEIHYSRYPKEYWRESLYKMKAGGVEVVSAYTIWIHHEEIEGEYDFTGNRDLRAFIETVKETGQLMMLRIGPWSHGEVRNGGFPDWLLKQDFEPRSNDEAYFEVVRKFYTKIYEQAEGFLLKDGGPIIGIQIENEYGHCGGLTGEEGEEHMRRLYCMAKEIGFDVPYYTATGWGGAVTGGLLPVMGGYCEAPWDQRLTEIEPSGNYIFTHERNDHNIGSDYGFGTGITFDLTKFPYLTAELGGGLQVTHHRRPVATAEDIGAMTMVKLGSGVNLLGYYMYHGGTNPAGKLTTLQESRETGYLNDLPVLNYDFRAPVREYGQVSDTYKELKLYTMFLKEFGSELCEMPAVIPEDNPLNPNDLSGLRYSFRHNGKWGFLFVNNYQRRYKMAEHEGVALQLELAGKNIAFSDLSVKDKEYFFYPIQMPVGKAVLKTAKATPLCVLHDSITTYVFYSSKEPEFQLENEDKEIKLLSISREDALNAWKITLDKEYLVITEAAVIPDKRGYQILGRKEEKLKVYPELTNVPEGFTLTGKEGEFSVYEKQRVVVSPAIAIEEVTTDKDKKKYEISIDYRGIKENDVFLRLSYDGDTAKLYGNELIADHFYTGETWEVGLKRFSYPEKLYLEVYTLMKDQEVFLETWPVLENGTACRLREAKAEFEYCTPIYYTC